ncbi:MAG: hypothetical protein Q4B48_07360 [Syntrophomonadaceae bacterium]|nr:hypothetical protein [Syntrophomonadaceae bacterium]
MKKDDYIKLISSRGNAYGEKGGTLDLLKWCNKRGLFQVTEDEARRFWEDPNSAYEAEEEKPDK